ncbi:MAG: ABC transporter ATP-binding protein, partial [Oscillochloris sp.]|nr:ABC transporter ATP-binding protein [Oscillochloris sp.]
MIQPDRFVLLDKRLWQMALPWWPRLLWAGLLTVVFAFVVVAQRALIGWVIALLLTGQTVVLWVFGAIAVLAVVAPLCYHTHVITGFVTAATIQNRLRERLYRKLMELGPAYTGTQPGGALLMTLTDGVYKLMQFFAMYIPRVIAALIATPLLLLFVAWLDPATAVIYAVTALVILVLPTFTAPWAVRASEQQRVAYAGFGSAFLDSLHGLPTLQAFGQTGARITLLTQRAREVLRQTLGVLTVSTVGISAASAVALLGLALGLGWAGVRVSEGELSLAVLVVLLLIGLELFRPLTEVATNYQECVAAVTATDRISAILDTQPVVAATAQAPVPALSRGLPLTLDFEKVSFSYPGERGFAVRDVSFTLQSGERIGIVGASGAGKTTLTNLLQRLYDPSAGAIRLNGQDIRDLPLEQLRAQIAVVGQETFLFNGPVAENLRVGKADATDDELVIAAKAANAHAFIEALPDGYATRVGERGVRLSGGERQRIAIARAILRDAPILILDEATSSVDAENEAAIQSALDRLSVGRLTLIVAHRLSSLARADRCLVFERGQLVAVGTHRELLAQNGVYARLMAQQARESQSHAIGEYGAPPDDIRGPAEPASVRRGESGEIVRAGAAINRQAVFGFLGGWLQRKYIQIGLASFLLLLSEILKLGVPFVAAIAVTAFIDGAAGDSWLVLLAVVTALAIALNEVGLWLSHALAFRVFSTLRVAFFRKLDALGPGYLQRRRSGDLVGIATDDIDRLEGFYAHWLPQLVVGLGLPLLALAALAWIDVALMGVIALFLIASGVVLFRESGKREAYDGVQHQLAELGTYVVDTIQGQRELMAFQYQHPWIARGRHYLDTYLQHLTIYFGRHYLRSKAIVDILAGLGITAGILTAYGRVLAGELEPSLVPAVMVLAIAVLTPAQELAYYLLLMARAFNAAARVATVMEEPAEQNEGTEPLPPERLSGGSESGAGEPLIRFADVSFQYDHSHGAAVKQVSFELRRGKTIALVGPSGAGKTTLAHLLLRFWDPEEGRILLEGTDIRVFDRTALRRQVALVAQDTYLFHTSIRENLLIARPGATDVELLAALERAGLGRS